MNFDQSANFDQTDKIDKINQFANFDQTDKINKIDKSDQTKSLD